jgi:MFS transporter, UMF1 family
LKKSNNNLILATWCLYDWACAAFPSIVTTFIFATYFTTTVAKNEITGTYQWANATSIAGVLIALMSPLFGAIADFAGYHKRWLFFFTALCVVSTSALWFAYPTNQSAYYMLTCVILGTVGLEIALVFYNSFLPYLVSPQYLGRISGWGWGCGYLGGILALSIALLLFIKSNFSWLNFATFEQVRICGPFVALWYIIFSIPFFMIVPEIPTAMSSMPHAIKSGIKELVRTVKDLPKDKNILLYLVSHMIYTDGLNTLFAFGGIYAAGTYHLSFIQILLFGISMNITAGIGAIALAWVDDYIGSKMTVMISLICLSIFGIPLLLLHNKYMFWFFALVLCLFVGPAQSASRSLMVRLMPGEETKAEMFGLYALSGKITAFIGPWVLGTVTLYFHNQRAGMATVLIFFVIGALSLIPVKEGGSTQRMAQV